MSTNDTLKPGITDNREPRPSKYMDQFPMGPADIPDASFTKALARVYRHGEPLLLANLLSRQEIVMGRVKTELYASAARGEDPLTIEIPHRWCLDEQVVLSVIAELGLEGFVMKRKGRIHGTTTYGVRGLPEP